MRSTPKKFRADSRFCRRHPKPGSGQHPAVQASIARFPPSQQRDPGALRPGGRDRQPVVLGPRPGVPGQGLRGTARSNPRRQAQPPEIGEKLGMTDVLCNRGHRAVIVARIPPG